MSNVKERLALISSGVSHQIVDVEPPAAPAGPEGELSAMTSLDDLLKAILGPEAARPDDRGRLVEVVEGQVHGIRQELGIPEPHVDPPPALPPSFFEFVRTRHPESRSFALWESAGWASRCARSLSRVLAATTWRRRPVLLILIAGGTIVLGFVVGAGSARSLSARTEPALPAAPPAPVAPASQDEAPALATSSATLGDSSAPMRALATSGAAADERGATAPVLVSSVPPVYPQSAPQRATVGNVEMDLTIDESGRVIRAAVTSGPSSLRDAAVTAVLQWRYQPAMADGAPVASKQRVRMSFE